MPRGRPRPSPALLSADWRVSSVTDGSVSRHLKRKSWPSVTDGAPRGVTNTVEASAGSERKALWVSKGGGHLTPASHFIYTSLRTDSEGGC